MDIEGIGSETVDQLVDLGLVQSPADLFDLRGEDWARLDKFKEKSIQNALDGLAASLKAESVSLDKKIGKVSVVGVGMKSHAGIASKMFKALADENINIQIITTSEIKISIVIEEKYLELAVRALHSAFDLGDPDYEKESIT
jgi:NAD-dependent DNA ligase